MKRTTKVLLNILVVLVLTSILLIVNNIKQNKEIIKATYSARVMGDIDGSGVINLTDVGRLYRGMKGIITLTSEEKKAGDVISDGTIDLSDVARLYRYHKGSINKLVVLTSPTLYTSDNIKSGNTHKIGFLLKLKSGLDVYYCHDSNNKCNPSTKYTGMLRYSTSTTTYLRYKACNGGNNCSSVGSYKVVLSISLSKGSNYSSGAISNPWGVAYYSQSDSRWGTSAVPNYPSSTISSKGCGYTALSMLMTGLTHNYNITPKTIISDLKSSKEKYQYTSGEASDCAGCMVHYAVKNSTLTNKYNYLVYRMWADWSWDEHYGSTNTYKKNAMYESLQMGHMLFVGVPGHYITVVGINSSNQMYIFDPAYYGAWTGSFDTFYNNYNNLRNRCKNNNNCGIQMAYEVYPKGGMSLEEWRNLGD